GPDEPLPAEHLPALRRDHGPVPGRGVPRADHAGGRRAEGGQAPPGRLGLRGGLHAPTTATVLRAQGDDVVTTDGPFAEAKEHLGGITVIDVPDLDAALHWGGRLARAVAPLAIEVRPFQEG